MICHIVKYVLLKALSKCNVELREEKKFVDDLEEFKNDLRSGYDAGGKDAFEKKENVVKKDFIPDQVL